MALTVPITVAGQLPIFTEIPIFIPIIIDANRDTGIAYGKEQIIAAVSVPAIRPHYTFVARSCGMYFRPNSKAPNSTVA
jgi:hypothetical protein